MAYRPNQPPKTARPAPGTPRAIREDYRVRQAIKQFRAQCYRQQPPCWICGQPIPYGDPTVKAGDPESLEVDHLYPISTHPDLAADPAGYRATHKRCNGMRGNSMAVPVLGQTSVDWENLPDDRGAERPNRLRRRSVDDDD